LDILVGIIALSSVFEREIWLKKGEKKVKKMLKNVFKR